MRIPLATYVGEIYLLTSTSSSYPFMYNSEVALAEGLGVSITHLPLVVFKLSTFTTEQG